MSGTSLDGIDAALIETDGERVTGRKGGVTLPYDDSFRDRLRRSLGLRSADAETEALEADLTHLHANVVARLLETFSLSPGAIGLVGFHGHTIAHDPGSRFTWQLGDGGLLAAQTGIDVVCDFRVRDVASGGEGAPFACAYHLAMAADLPKPCAVLNLGGVGNVTWIGDGGDLLAFDTGPANALIDDWVMQHTGRRYDDKGGLASNGTVDEGIVDSLMQHPYFDRKPPKSLDRNDFDASSVTRLGLEDGAATLTEFTVRAVAVACEHFEVPPRRWLVSGGGRHNLFLLKRLAETLRVPVDPVEAIGFDGDLVEAEAFALLAARSVQGLPLSWPTTTGVPSPMQGGRLFEKP